MAIDEGEGLEQRRAANKHKYFDFKAEGRTN